MGIIIAVNEPISCSPDLLAGGFSAANCLGIGDMVTLIGALKGKATPATQIAYLLNAPSIAEIISSIRSFNTAPTAAVR